MRLRLKWLGLWTLLGLVGSVQYFLADQRLASHPHTWWQALATSFSTWYLWGLLSLVVARLARRFQLDRAKFGRHFIIHLGASLDLALVQLFAGVGLQAVLHGLLREPFSFGQTLVDNFTLFYHWNVLTYWAIAAVVHALDYHAVLEERRVGAVESDARRPAERLLVADNGRSFFVRTADVDWIEAARNYVRLHSNGRVHTVRTTLAALEGRLDPGRFRRISRSALVNLDHIHEVQPWFHGDAIVILETGARVTLSRRYRRNLLTPATP
ncbi:MAG TPA: LytTR family DNA-binding domain-containing protein [Gemmatimonadales bacterium]|nr:LytTR family DNA-binding domain-containing protein [Gemmatimonadales bacterium]